MEKVIRKSEHSANAEIDIIAIEKDYLRDNLYFYINQNAPFKRTVSSSTGWHIIPTDRETKIHVLLIDYIIEHFTICELYLIFYCDQECFAISSEIVRESKQQAIQNINGVNFLTKKEAIRLKRKVWDLNPVMFALIHELIMLSDLFYDEEREDVVIPDFAKY